MASDEIFRENLWLWSAGEVEIEGAEAWSLDELRRTEWSDDFEGHMRRRLIFGAVRYRRLAARFKPQYDRIASIRKRLDAYEATGNLAWLVDVANLCLLEFIEGRHPKRHFAETEEHDMRAERK